MGGAEHGEHGDDAMDRCTYRAYSCLLNEALGKALDCRQPKRAAEAFDDWLAAGRRQLASASRSRLKPS